MQEDGISGTAGIALSELLEEIPAGICRFRTDENLTILEANELFYSLFGYAKETALRDGFRSIYFLLNEAEAVRVRTHIELLRSGKLPARGEFELSVQHPSGANVVVLTRYHSHGVPCQWLTVNVIDITNRKHVQEELQHKLEASRVKAMINQMQPHFLYNALSAIRTIIRKDPDKAYDLLYDFTVHLRSSIKAFSSDDPIPFTDELKNIKAYLNIEKMRFGDILHIAYEIDCETFSVVPLSIQPLAENAARHGVYDKGAQGGTIIIRSYEATDSYVVEVEDDGVGFDVEKALHKNENSYGLRNLMFRLETLMHARVDIHSTIGQGTLICVFFPKAGENA